MTILYNRRALSMGDDARNGVYRIRMPEDATLGGLVGVLLRGGNGNDWPIPQTSLIGWTVFSNVGTIADVSADKKRADFHMPEDASVSALGIEWVFGARADEEPDASELARLFGTGEKSGAGARKVSSSAEHSGQDLRYASELREDVHREALAIVRRTRPDIAEVVDRHPAEDYLQEHWDYPGKWYTTVAIPDGYGSRKALVDAIVRDTLSGAAPEERQIPESRGECGVGSAPGPAGACGVPADPEHGRPKAEDDGRPAAEAQTASKPEEDPFYLLLAEYPELDVDYCLVRQAGRYLGYESHRTALKTAWRMRFAAHEDGEPRQGSPNLAVGKRIAVEELFSSDYREGELNYRRAFLYPPRGNGYSGKDFARLNAALFPKGTDGLEAYAWTADWSDYFDEGREWWGTLCLTVYDRSLDRFAVILASATD